MSKPIKNLIVQSYRQTFEGLEGAVIVNISGVEANEVNTLRSQLAEKNMKAAVVKNSLARLVFAGTDMEAVNELLEGPCTMVYGLEDVSVVNVARELVDAVESVPNLDFVGAVMEGTVFGPDKVEELSKYPMREEAQANVITLLLSPARNLAGSLTGGGGTIAALVKAIQEKKEAGEEIQAA